MSLGAAWVRCSCDNCGYIDGAFVRVREIVALATRGFCQDGFYVARRGQFLVSRKRIRSHPPQLYWTLQRALVALPGHAMHADRKYVLTQPIHDALQASELGGGHDSPFGHALERAWSVVFGCADGRGSRGCECATRVGGAVHPDACNAVGEREPCQCVDGE